MVLTGLKTWITVGCMFERFTNRARHVVVLAQDEARDMGHNYIGTEHLLLGLLGVPDGLAGRALAQLGLTLDGVREETAGRVGRGAAPVKGRIPFTPRAKKVLELSLREALQLHHNYIGTEHLLLGLLREGEGVAASILREHTNDLLRIRMAVLDLLPAGTQPAAARGRRWLRRRSEVPTTIADEPEELSTTPAADASLDEAAKLAGHAPVGSHHLLLAALADPDTAAAKVLATLGVDLERAREALRQADVTGTSDELPEVRGRRQMLIRVSQDRLTIEAADEAIVALGRAALESLAGQPTQARQAAQGAQAGQPTEAGQPAEAGVIRGDLPVSSSLSDVWQALHDSLEDIRGRAAMARAQRERDEGEQPASGGGEAAAS
jgi:ATP-dependent Clp protease ATP-binding subunit ClpC